MSSFQELVTPLKSLARSCYTSRDLADLDLEYLRCITSALIQVENGSCNLSPPSSQYALFVGYCPRLAAIRGCQARTDHSRQCKRLVDEVFVGAFKCQLSSAEWVCILIPLAVIAFTIMMYAIKHMRPESVQCKQMTAPEAQCTERWQSGFLRQFTASLNRVIWLKRRRPCRTVLELVAPSGLCAFLVLMVHVKPPRGLLPKLTIDTQSSLAMLRALNPSLQCSALTVEIESCAPSTTTEQFYDSSSLLMALFLLLSFSQIISDATAGLCREKESRLKCVLDIMGLQELPSLLGWLTGQWVCSLPLMMILCLELKSGSVFVRADLGELALFFLLFGSAMFCGCSAMNTFFSRSKIASWVSVIIFSGSTLLFFQVYQASQSAQMAAALIPSVAFAFGIYGQLQAARMGSGLCHTAASFFDLEDLSQDILPLSTCCWMLLVDSIWLTLAAMYFQKVLPQEYGRRKAWHYPITQLFHEDALAPELGVAPSTMEASDTLGYIQQATPEQQVQQQNMQCIQCIELKHRYGDHLALKGLSLVLYPNQVTGILGENGAGKSTTISILAGLIEQSSGCLSVFGKSCAVRPSVCFQTDVLIPHLTVREHLKFFSNIMGVPLDIDWEGTATELGLAPKLNSPVGTLSGGQKRKVGVAIAMLSDAPLVLLDEPTAGCDEPIQVEVCDKLVRCDPASRRQVWSLVRSKRSSSECVILVCTHYLAEADELCDRICVVASGTLLCAGDSAFLKQQFGCGYILRIGKSPGCNVETLVTKMKLHSEVNLVFDASREVSLQIEATGEQLAHLLKWMEDSKRELAIEEFAVSMTTLEDAYLQLQQQVSIDQGGSDYNPELNPRTNPSGFHQLDQIDEPVSPKARDSEFRRDEESTKHRQIWIFMALLKKRGLYTLRDRKGFLLAAVLPLVFLFALSVQPGVDVSVYAKGYQPEIPADPVAYAQCQAQLQNMPCAYSASIWRQLHTFSFEDPMRPGFYLHHKITPYTQQNLIHHSYPPNDGWKNVTFRNVGRFHMKQLDTDQAGKYQAGHWFRPLDDAAFIYNMVNTTSQGAVYRFYTHSNLHRYPLQERNQSTVVTDPRDGGDAIYSFIRYGKDWVANRVQPDNTPVDQVTSLNPHIEFVLVEDEARVTTPDNILSGGNRTVSIRCMHNPTLWWHVGDDGMLQLRDHAQATKFRVVRGVSMDNPTCECTAIPNPLLNQPRCGGYGLSLKPETHFSYCALGIHNCDVSECSNNRSPESPQHPCNMVGRCEDKSRLGVCYSSKCMNKRDLTVQAEINTILKTLVILLANSFAPVTLAVYIVKEKEPGADAKRQQMLAGCGFGLYWLSNAVFDSLTLLIPAVFSIIYCSTEATLSDGDSSLAICAALILAHVCAALPLTYAISARQNNHSKAQTAVLSVILVTGALASIIGFLVRMLNGNRSKRMVTVGLDWVLLLFPGYAMQTGLMNVAMRKFTSRRGMYFDFWRMPSLLQSSCYNPTHDWRQSFPFDRHCYFDFKSGCCSPLPLDFVVGLRPLLYLLGEAVLLWLWVLFRDRVHKWCSFLLRRKLPVEEGGQDEHGTIEAASYVVLEDVSTTEVALSESGELSQNDAIIVDRLCKVYGYDQTYCCGGAGVHTALRALSFRANDEVFALLGVNGAGKTTTIDILTGATSMTSGHACVAGGLVGSEQARKAISLCPQHDPLLAFLTPKEQLELYCNICGADPQECERLMKLLQLQKHANTMSGLLSGGNKRKLTLGLALIKNPQVLILDEPTNGVDPVARRYIWHVLREVRKHSAPTILLTSHSLDEVEALCDRIAVLANGIVHCSGTLLELKAQHHAGYSLVCRFSSELGADTTKLQREVEEYIEQHPDQTPCNAIRAVDSALDDVVDQIALQFGTDVPCGTMCSMIHQYRRMGIAKAFMQETWPEAEEQERNGQTVRYSLGSDVSGTCISAVFETMEKNKAKLQICEYSISQNTLEDLFHTISKEAH